MNMLEMTADQLRRLDTANLEGRAQELHHFLIERGGYWDIDPNRPQTLRACWEVLCRLPEAVSAEIMYGDPVVLIAPTRACWGLARPMSFPVRPANPEKPSELPQAKVRWVYLAPELEDQTDRVIVAVIAHELAHVMIGDIAGEESEIGADALIREWGFVQELDELREANPNHRY